MNTHLATLATAAQHWGQWGPHMAGHAGGPGWWLVFPIAFLVFLFGLLGVAYLYVIRRTRPPQQPPSDA